MENKEKCTNKCGCGRSHKHSHSHSHGAEASPWWRIGLSAVLLASGMFVSGEMAEWIDVYGLLWYGVAYILVAASVLKGAVSEALKGDVFSEFMLMSVASIGAFCIGEYPEAVAVMLLYCVGEALQDLAVERARANIRSLLEFRPDKAVVVEDGKAVEKSPEMVKVGDIIEVRPGERVPLDGKLVTEDAAFNTVALTGESVPRVITSGGEVLAGMIAFDTVVRVRVSRLASESAIARILKMVEDASEKKAPTELFIRRFARVYTPVVVVLAVLTVLVPWLWSFAVPSYDYVFGEWLRRALVFLVISCPCALVISIPLGYFVGIGAASRRGILFKGSNGLDAVAALDAVVFDKTGTLTKGEFSVQKVEGLTADDLRVVMEMERGSNHPIAKAVVRYVESVCGVDQPSMNVVIRDMPGFGLGATVGDDKWLLGTTRLLSREGIGFPKKIETLSETVVVCAKNGAYVGCLLLSDTLKEDASRAVNDLRDDGMRNIVILSGDKQALVDRIASVLGVDEGYGDLLPQGKVKHIERLKLSGKKVAFVGDGINDAPVLALSDVGFAMGGMGADMAVETADVVIQTDRPSKVAEAIRIGKHTRAVVKQNIVFAIGMKVLVMLLGLLGIANLWMAVFADSGVALLAVLNSVKVFVKKRS